MALKAPVRDIGVSGGRARLCLALLALFCVTVTGLALLERLGIATEIMPQAVVATALLLSVVTAAGAAGHRPVELSAAGRSVAASAGGLAVAAAVAGLPVAGMVAGAYAGVTELIATACGLAAGLVLAALLVAPPLRRFGYGTGEFLAARFGTAPSVALATVAFCGSFLILVAVLDAAALLLAGLAPLPRAQALQAAILLTLACVLPGGLRSLTWTQVTLFGIIVLGCFVPVALLVSQATETAVTSFPLMPDLLLRPVREAGWLAAPPFLLGAAGAAALPFATAAAVAATSARAARGTLLWSALALILLLLGAAVLAQSAGAAGAGAILSSPLATPLLGSVAAVVSGLAAAALLGAVVAAAAAALHSASATLSRDIWQRAIDREAPAGRRLVYARLSALAVAAAALYCTRIGPVTPLLLGWALALLAAGRLVPVLLGLRWPRCSAAGAMGGAAAGSALVTASLLLEADTVVGLGGVPGWMAAAPAAATAGVLLALLVCMAVSLLGAEPPAESQDLVRSLREGEAGRPLRERPA